MFQWTFRCVFLSKRHWVQDTMDDGGIYYQYAIIKCVFMESLFFSSFFLNADIAIILAQPIGSWTSIGIIWIIVYRERNSYFRLACSGSKSRQEFYVRARKRFTGLIRIIIIQIEIWPLIFHKFCKWQMSFIRSNWLFSYYSKQKQVRLKTSAEGQSLFTLFHRISICKLGFCTIQLSARSGPPN